LSNAEISNTALVWRKAGASVNNLYPRQLLGIFNELRTTIMRNSMAMTSILFAIFFSHTTNAAMMTFDVYAYENSSSGGVGLNTRISFRSGDVISGFADPDDLWNAGPSLRWSNADGLVTDLFATGADDSGESSGTQIGSAFDVWTDNNLSAPYGSLVGEIDSVYFLLGTKFDLIAPADGELSLYYWDQNQFDNTQFITVSVDDGIPEVPLPAAAWLFGSALLGLLAFTRRSKGLAQDALDLALRKGHTMS
jgi:hypothetical protein